MKILVVGGAGYIGSHMVKQLAQAGNDVITLDNLSYGYRDAVKYGKFVEGDLGDDSVLNSIFAAGDIDAVMHFAGFIQVGESVIKPSMYYHNNVVNTFTLLDAMLRHEVKNFIFSSTAAIFGEPDYTPIDEKHNKQPINPYGHSKLMIEQVLDDYDKAYGLRSTCLRYFNAAGADRMVNWASAMYRRRISSRSSCRQPPDVAKTSRYLVMTMPPMTAPVCATTYISMIYAKRTRWPWTG